MQQSRSRHLKLDWQGGRRYGPDADLPAKDLSASHLIWAFFEAHPLEAP